MAELLLQRRSWLPVAVVSRRCIVSACVVCALLAAAATGAWILALPYD